MIKPVTAAQIVRSRPEDVGNGFFSIEARS